LAAQAAGHFFVAPDNGLLSFLSADAHFVSLPVPRGAAPTFHARDLFAPAAGQLALGASLSHLGQPITDPYRSPLPAPREDGGVVVGEVIYVDRFGTLISNIPGDAVEPGVRIKVAGTEIGTLARSFGDVKRGVLVAFVGSGGTVEIAVRDGSAAGSSPSAQSSISSGVRCRVSGVGVILAQPYAPVAAPVSLLPIGQVAPQFVAGPVDIRFHRAQRKLQDPGDFLVRVALHVA